MAASQAFDYIIIGGGMSGLQLAKAFIEDPFFNKLRIGIIEQSSKTENDRMWSFWEKGAGQWDSLVTKSWKTGQFFSETTSLQFPLHPYKYKTVRSIDFYNACKASINKSLNCTWITDVVLSVRENSQVTVKGKHNSYTAKHVFDSRLPSQFKDDQEATTLLQHFKGYIIETKTPHFEVDSFTMMDYRLIYNDTTSFTYVLPFSKTKALIEYTFFSPHTVNDSVYDSSLTNYISNILKISDYEVTETEQGVIPMSTYNFSQHHSDKITKIGTAGGWVKASSGYSFKNTEGLINELIQNIKSNKAPHYNLNSKRHEFYDRIFLQVLYDHNALGPELFERFYKRNNIKDCFDFLDNASSIWQELKIIWSLKSWKFVNALFKILKK